MTKNTYSRLLSFLARLEEHRITYTLGHYRDEAVMVTVAVPGERWEVEFLEDGTVEVERFLSTGEIEDERRFDELFSRLAV